MRLILTQDVPHLGTSGSVVSVRGGYGRNFLLPRMLAIPANESNEKELAHQKRVFEARRKKMLAEAQALAKKIEKISLTVTKPVGEEERIFGAVTTAELEELLLQQGVTVSRKDMSLPEDIKKVGVYHAEVKVHPEVTARFKVWVVAQPQA